MLNSVNQLGLFGWVYILIAVAVVVLAVRYAIQLFGQNAATSVDINGIIHLAVFGLVLSVFSNLLGVYQGLQILPQLSSAQVAAGLGQALLAPLCGLVILIMAMVFWSALRLRMRKLKSIAD